MLRDKEAQYVTCEIASCRTRALRNSIKTLEGQLKLVTFESKTYMSVKTIRFIFWYELSCYVNNLLHPEDLLRNRLNYFLIYELTIVLKCLLILIIDQQYKKIRCPKNVVHYEIFIFNIKLPYAYSLFFILCCCYL